ncbi:MAG: adenosylcobinamide amidohydrolase [Rhodoblastus sp.]
MTVLDIHCEQPWLIVCLPARCMTLGWSLARPGFVETSTIAWLEVRNADLTPDVDPLALLRNRLTARGLDDAVAFMTARDVRRHHVAQRRTEQVEACCVATVGLANGEAVGSRRVFEALPSTINTLVHVSRPLTQAAFIEALSIVAQARTAAILDTSHLREGPRITGTGTDCIVVAAPIGSDLLDCAGLHTAVGEAIGGAVYDAVRAGAEEWSAEQLAGGN